MSSDDEFGGLLDRESVLAGGVPARRANTVLFLIESRTAQLVARSRLDADLFTTQEGERELAFLEAFALGREPTLRPTIQDVERHALWVGLPGAGEPQIAGGRRPPPGPEVHVHLPRGTGYSGGVGPGCRSGSASVPAACTGNR